jgi:hypothetical protein
MILDGASRDDGGGGGGDDDDAMRTRACVVRVRAEGETGEERAPWDCDVSRARFGLTRTRRRWIDIYARTA